MSLVMIPQRILFVHGGIDMVRRLRPRLTRVESEKLYQSLSLVERGRLMRLAELLREYKKIGKKTGKLTGGSK